MLLVSLPSRVNYQGRVPIDCISLCYDFQTCMYTSINSLCSVEAVYDLFGYCSKSSLGVQFIAKFDYEMTDAQRTVIGKYFLQHLNANNWQLKVISIPWNILSIPDMLKSSNATSKFRYTLKLKQKTYRLKKKARQGRHLERGWGPSPPRKKERRKKRRKNKEKKGKKKERKKGTMNNVKLLHYKGLFFPISQ